MQSNELEPQRTDYVHNQQKNTQRTFNGFFVKVKFKLVSGALRRCSVQCMLLLVFFVSVFSSVAANRPPRFLIDGQTEIVLRLKEGEDTPVGKLYKICLKGFIYVINNKFKECIVNKEKAVFSRVFIELIKDYIAHQQYYNANIISFSTKNTLTPSSNK